LKKYLFCIIIFKKAKAMSNKEENQGSLKVLRVNSLAHQIAKINAVKQGIKLQTYMEKLISADEQGLVNWDQMKQPS